MGLETGTYIADLVETNPTATDAVSQGDDHIRLIKKVLKDTFPGATGPGAKAIQFKQDGTGAVNRDVDEKLRESVSVLDFMTEAEIYAVQNNDYTGSVTNLASALQSAFSSGATAIYFPPGIYRVTGVIHIPDVDNLTLFGCGKASQIYFDATGLSGSAEIFLGNQLSGATYTTSGITIKDLWFKGHYTTPNVTPSGGVSYGIKFINTVDNLEITGCYFSNFSAYSCQVLTGTDVRVSNNTFYRGHRAAIALGSASTYWVRQYVVANNIINEMVNIAIDADGILLAGAEFGSVTGNTIYMVSHTGIKLGVANYTTVTGNKIRKVVDGVKAQNGGSFNSVVGNNINQCRAGVLGLAGNSSYQINHYHIADNVIEDCKSNDHWIVTEFGAPAPGANYGIYLQGGATDVFNYLSVTNNQVSNANRGVSLATSTYNYAFLSGNQARDGVTLGYTYIDNVVASSTIFQDNQLAGSRDFPFAQDKWARNLLLGGASDSAVNRRKFTTASAAPTTGTWAVGDVVFNNTMTATNTVMFWYCETAGTPGSWVAGAWFNARGTTAQRPTPGPRERITYLDTTLAANGKPIWWTGTIWVDALGASV